MERLEDKSAPEIKNASIALNREFYILNAVFFNNRDVVCP